MKKHYLILILFFFCSFTAPPYQHIQTESHSIHILEVDPKKFTIVPAKALDQSIGRETVYSIAMRKGAVAAVNGGFFSEGGYQDGVPCGILKIDRKWYGLPIKPRGAIGWKKEGQKVLFDRVLTHIEGIDFHVDPQTGYTQAKEWEDMNHIVGGAPLLIQNGKRTTDFSSEMTLESFLTKRYARTAVGLLSNGNWIFVVVDAMTIDELAQLMESLRCVEALNLDGGSSSTLVYQNQAYSHHCYEEERRVSDAILIFPG